MYCIVLVYYPFSKMLYHCGMNFPFQMLSEAHMASTSNSGPSKRNASKAVLPTEATNPGNGHGNRMGPSSSWISSLPRISSAK
jgi:hypothetical protein